MSRTKTGGAKISVEIWRIDANGLYSVLMKEPHGLCVGKIELCDGTTALGVLAEDYIYLGQKEITEYGGWREYKKNAKTESNNNI